MEYTVYKKYLRTGPGSEENFRTLLSLAYPGLSPEADITIYSRLLELYGHVRRRGGALENSSGALETEFADQLTKAAISVGKAISRLQIKLQKKIGAEGQRYLDEMKVRLYQPTPESISQVIDKSIFVFREYGIVL